MRSWRTSLALYTQPRILALICLGFSSGLPLALTGATLDGVLNQSGVTKTAIGLFAIVGTPYTLKFLWAPFIDRLPLPYLTDWFGRRRSWILLTQAALMLSIVALGMTDPAEHLELTAALALLVAFCSASQDVVIDAYRVEILSPTEQGAGASAATFGYITAMKLIAGALAFYLSDILPWSVVYAVMAALMLVGVVAVILAGEPENHMPIKAHKSWLIWVKESVINPFTNFMKHQNWWAILLFVVFYKFGDAFAGKMTTPFLQDIGFSNSEIAFYLKTFGLAATLAGTFMGGVIVYRYGLMPSLWACGLLQMGSNLMFVLQAHMGNDAQLLAVTVAVENLSGGMGTAAFVAYLASLCNVQYTATQYALLSSLAATGRTWLSASSGWFVDQLGWVGFFLLSTAVAIPGLLILWWLMKQGVVVKRGKKKKV